MNDGKDDLKAGMSGCADLEAAAGALQRGEVVAVPTDTVYGLVADPRRSGSVERIFALKHRPSALALPVLVADTSQALSLVAPEARARLLLLAGSFWPGALTIVLPRAAGLEMNLGGDAASIGLRCPEHRKVRMLCSLVGPLASTSANRHGGQPCATAADVRALFGEELTVLDGGPCTGDPSTVVSVTGPSPVLLRAGSVSFEAVLAAIAADATARARAGRAGPARPD